MSCDDLVEWRLSELDKKSDEIIGFWETVGQVVGNPSLVISFLLALPSYLLNINCCFIVTYVYFWYHRR